MKKVVCLQSISKLQEYRHRMRRENLEKQIRDAVHQHLPDVQAYIYGSEARGEAKSDSDVDVLLLVNGPKPGFAERQVLIAPLYDIELETGYSINPHIESVSDWETLQSVFKYQVMKDRIRV